MVIDIFTDNTSSKFCNRADQAPTEEPASFHCSDSSAQQGEN